jgi:hypothetical protein
MRIYKLMLAAVAVLVLALGAIGVRAAEDDTLPPSFTDGRLNAYDTAAPLAVYCHFEYPYASDVNRGELDRIEVWGYVGEFIKPVISVDAETIDEIGVDAAEDQAIASSDGYGLWRASDGSFYVTGPNYRFNWERGDQGC